MKLLEQIRGEWPMLKRLDPPPQFSDTVPTGQARLLAAYLEDNHTDHSTDLLSSLYGGQVWKEFCIGVLKGEPDPFPIYDLIRSESERLYRDDINDAILAEQNWWSQQNYDDDYIEDVNSGHE